MQANYKEISKDAVMYDELIKKLCEGKKIAFKDVYAFDMHSQQLMRIRYVYRDGTRILAKLDNGIITECKIDIFDVNRYIGEYEPKSVKVYMTPIVYKDGIGVPAERTKVIAVSDEFLIDNQMSMELLRHIKDTYFVATICDIKCLIEGRPEEEARYIRRS